MFRGGEGTARESETQHGSLIIISNKILRLLPSAEDSYASDRHDVDSNGPCTFDPTPLMQKSKPKATLGVDLKNVGDIQGMVGIVCS